MSRKSTILALAAIASLGSLALSSTSASAFGHGRGFGGGGSHMGGMHMSGGMHRLHGGGHFRPGGIAFRRVAPFRPHWPHPQWLFGWRRPYWLAPVIVTVLATTYATAPTWNLCTCLTKEY